METAIKKEKTKTMTVYWMAAVALFTAITCILGPMSIQIGVIPISFTNLVIFFAVFLLGGKGAVMSCLVYLLLGIAGLPVFSGFTGGLAKITGPTGGFLVGFIWLAVISAFFIKKFPGRRLFYVVGMVLGMAVCYLFGTVWFIILMKVTWQQALAACVFPFLIGDVIKIAIAILIGPLLRSRLIQAGLLTVH